MEINKIMKKLTINEIMKSDKVNLHVRFPSVLMASLQKEADKLYGRNKSLLIIGILAERYDILANE